MFPKEEPSTGRNASVSHITTKPPSKIAFLSHSLPAAKRDVVRASRTASRSQHVKIGLERGNSLRVPFMK